MSSGNINSSSRPAEPVRQFTPGPPNNSGVDYVKENISKQQRSNFHSSSLTAKSEITMAAARVNKTALHPGGVEYVATLTANGSIFPPILTRPSSAGRNTSTLNSRRNSTSVHTSTTTVSPL